MVKQRSFLGLLFLSMITFGIYGIAWYYLMSRDINTVVGEDGKSVDPGLALVLAIFTFGIYPIIWLYIEGDRMKAAGDTKGANIKDSGVTYLLWMLLGSLIVIGPIVALVKFINNYNTLVVLYNAKLANSQ